MTRVLKHLPDDDWPAADRNLWQAKIETIGLLDDPSPAQGWSAGTRATLKYAYARWLGHLRSASPNLLNQHPIDRISPESIAAYVAELRSSMGTSGTHNYIKHLYDTLRAFDPNGDWRWLREVCRRPERLVDPTNKRPRMVSANEVLDLGLNLIDQASMQERLRPHERGIRYRDGLVIALLATRPIRRRNLQMIRIDGHIIPDQQGYRLTFDASETKTKEPLEFTLPDLLTEPMDTYLDHYRPLIAGSETHDGLWASMKGCPMSGEALYDRVIKHTQDAFGKSINLHLFRSIVATSIATDDPEKCATRRRLWGILILWTTERYYIQANAVKAARTYQSGIEALRRNLQDAADAAPPGEPS